VAARAYAGTRAAPGRRASSRRSAPRRRPARRPARRRNASRIDWDKLGRVGLTIVLAVVLFSYLNPMLNFVETYRETRAQRVHLQGALDENDRLHIRVQSADDPEVLEREARRQGLVAPGERPYAVVGLSN
jgi:septum formation initiator